jgi:hypothetical protein
MKFNIELDVTPEELRRFLGLPDVAPLQEELMNKLKERIDSGMTDYDPVKLMEPFLTGNLKSFESMQKLFWNAMSNQTEAGKK